jgi:protein-L-isoaspartate(D-aspartate) O-methyltransferase
MPDLLQVLFLLLLGTLAACGGENGPPQDARGTTPDAHVPAPAPRLPERLRMVADQIEDRGLRDPHVLAALRAVPRHEFVPAHLADAAYEDGPLPIGSGQTISQPYIVALMTEAVGLQPGERVLDVGTGSGYQAAVLAHITPHVWSIEIVPELAQSARERLARLGYGVQVRTGDGWAGWPEQAPFDAIILAAAPERVPPALLEQLAPGGRLCLPVGGVNEAQELLVYTREADGSFSERRLGGVRFVPMTGEAQRDG